MITQIANLPKRWLRGHTDVPIYEPDAVLQGLPPQLIINLARLAGATLDDLSVTLQLMPYGYRAAMAAYHLIEMDEPKSNEPRRVRAMPSCLEVIAAAAELVASVADPADVAMRLGDDYGAQTVAQYVPMATPEERSREDELILGATVQVTETLPDGRKMVRVELNEGGPLHIGHEGHRNLTFMTDQLADFEPNTEVDLAYPSETILHATPSSIVERV